MARTDRYRTGTGRLKWELDTVIFNRGQYGRSANKFRHFLYQQNDWTVGTYSTVPVPILRANETVDTDLHTA